MGVGNKALPALTSTDRTLRNDEPDLVGQWSDAQNFDFGAKFDTASDTPNHRSSVHLANVRNAPALRSIMEQGKSVLHDLFGQ